MYYILKMVGHKKMTQMDERQKALLIVKHQNRGLPHRAIQGFPSREQARAVEQPLYGKLVGDLVRFRGFLWTEIFE